MWSNIINIRVTSLFQQVKLAWSQSQVRTNKTWSKPKPWPKTTLEGAFHIVTQTYANRLRRDQQTFSMDRKLFRCLQLYFHIRSFLDVAFVAVGDIVWHVQQLIIRSRQKGTWRDMCSGCREHSVTCAVVIQFRQSGIWRDMRSSYAFPTVGNMVWHAQKLSRIRRDMGSGCREHGVMCAVVAGNIVWHVQWLSGIWRDMCSGCREHGVTCAAIVHPRQEETWRDIRSSYSVVYFRPVFWCEPAHRFSCKIQWLHPSRGK